MDHIIRHVSLLCVLTSMLAAVKTSAQTTPSVPDARAASLRTLEQGKFDTRDVERVAGAGMTEAIPALKTRFVQEQDEHTKAKIAAALVRLGERGDSYWQFVADHARPAIETDAPWPRRLDSQPKGGGELSPEFVAWSETHHVKPVDAAHDAVFDLPLRVIIMAQAGDARGIPILRRGLLSPNWMVEAMSAKGLAQVQDKDSIPLIIEACKKAPDLMAAGIAEALVYFTDARAQDAADIYLPKEWAKLLRAWAQDHPRPLTD